MKTWKRHWIKQLYGYGIEELIDIEEGYLSSYYFKRDELYRLSQEIELISRILRKKLKRQDNY